MLIIFQIVLDIYITINTYIRFCDFHFIDIVKFEVGKMYLPITSEILENEKNTIK